MMRGLSSRATRLGLVGVVTTALAASFAGVAEAAPRDRGTADDRRAVGKDYNKGKALPFSATLSEKAAGNEDETASVGSVRRWPALDDERGVIYVKNYRLMGLGDHIEIWVATDTQYPAGDCRNTVDGGAPTQVTQAQVDAFVEEFDENMYPKESEAFSVPPVRDGSRTALTKAYSKYLGLPNRTYKGDGDNIVALIDNVRDKNYYEPTAPDGKTYIAGFHYSVFNEMTNRNVMTIDTFDWKHRTGANPPDDSSDPEYVACGTEIGRAFGDPRPRTYEGTFAHEYQHLLEYYADRDESTWVNEGLSDWAQTLVGYVDPRLDPADVNADGHLATFLGFNEDESYGGPEQSMTRWEDQGAPEILADYGAAYAFMEYLHSQFGGDAFMSALHTAQPNGLDGLQSVLDAQLGEDAPDVMDVLHSWLASMALDGAIDDGAGVVAGDAAALQTGSMSARINWDNPQTYESPGAPTNGADFVRLRDATGAGVTASAAGPLSFDGAEGFPSQPMEWVQDGDRLYSGAGDNLDRAIAREVTVPAGNPTMTVEMEYDTELSWDFAFVQVYDGEKWVSLSNANTTDEADPQADPAVVANLPGFTGSSGGVTQQTFDLTAYAGESVKVAIRYITDGAVANPGVWVSGLSVGGTPVPGATDLGTWDSLTEAAPVPVDGWTVQLVGYTDGVSAGAVTLDLDENNAATVQDPAAALGFDAETVAVLVTVDDRSELQTQYAAYTLTANGVGQGA